MSMDIRKWFGGGSAESQKASNLHGKKKSQTVQSSPTRTSPRRAGKVEHSPVAKKSKRKKRQIIESDSEEDGVVDNKETLEILANDSDASPCVTARGKVVGIKKLEPSATTKGPAAIKKLVAASDFFGSAAPARSSKGIAAVTRNKGTSKVSLDAVSTAPDIHSETRNATIHVIRRSPRKRGLSVEDEEDNADAIFHADSNNKKRKESTPHKNSSSKSNSLSSKLSAAKARASNSEEVGNSSSIVTSDLVTANINNNSIEDDGKSSLAKPSQEVTKCDVDTNQQNTPTAALNNGGGEGELTKSASSSSGYRAYLHREGPRALGSKEIPEGGENCLEGLTFVVTGVLESMDRDECKSLVERYGGKVTTGISKKTSFVIMGREAGQRKVEMAEKFGTKKLDEDGLLDLIRTLPGKKSKYQVAAPPAPVLKPKQHFDMASSSGSYSKLKSTPQGASESSLMWVDKYKPTNMKQIIGQQGEKSCANKLRRWLVEWDKCYSTGAKKKYYMGGGASAGGDWGKNAKAALLSGPPGVGKTTTAHIVCKEAGYTFVELNASDTRSKKSLETEVRETVTSYSINDMLRVDCSKQKGRHCLIMDEVDGMAGTEDRGGIQELIDLIKRSKVPIICLCNDRNHAKIRSLANYCFDLRFYRPRMEQIKGMVMSVAFKEGVRIPPPAVDQVITAANHDIRQVLHNLSMWTATDKALTYDDAKVSSASAKKDIKQGPFDIAREVLCGGGGSMSVDDKLSLFFHDYSIAPLFIQENYPHIAPYSARGDTKRTLSALSDAADLLATGDIVERVLRRENNWSLLPTQAVFSSLLPGEVMRGSMAGHMVNFPSWLGKNSKHNKLKRLLQEIYLHSHLRISGDVGSVNLDYLPHFYSRIMEPLTKRGQDGIQESLQALYEYDLVREDIENMSELLTYNVTGTTGQQDQYSKLDSKVKAAFTRAYNKNSHLNPYSLGTNAPAKKSKVATGDDSGLAEEIGEGDNVDEEEDEDNVDTDAMIKAKRKPKQHTSTTIAKGKGTKKRK